MSTRCGHCGAEVTQGFKVCACCGAHYRRNLTKPRIGFSLFLALAGVAIIGNGNMTGVLWLPLAAAVVYFSSKKQWFRHNA